MYVLLARQPARSSRRRSRRQASMVWVYIVLMALVVLFAAPFYWLLVTALKTIPELSAFPVHFWPAQAQWGTFLQAVTLINFPVYATNSFILSGIYTVLVTLSSALVGFGFARLRGPAKRLLFVIMLSTLMLPPILTVIPTYVLFSRIGFINTYWPWVVWGLGSSPFFSFLFRQFFQGIPNELVEAAVLDGCPYLRIFWQIFLPLSLPVIATVAIFAFTGTWGDFITPSLFLSQDNTTLSVAMTAGYTDPHGDALNNIVAAGAVLYILPVILLFGIAQRYFVRGIVTTGLKG